MSLYTWKTLVFSLLCHTCSLCRVELVIQFLARGLTQVLLCLFPGVLWLWHFLYSVSPHPFSSLHIYTFVVSRAFMAVAASQAGDADSSRAPGLTSGLQGSVNVHRGALVGATVTVHQFVCIFHIIPWDKRSENVWRRTLQVCRDKTIDAIWWQLSQLFYSQKWKSQIQISGREGPNFFKEYSDSKNKYTDDDIINMLEFLVDNIFVVFMGKVFQQIVGIPMGINCAPLLGDIFLYSYKAEFIQSLLSTWKKKISISVQLHIQIHRWHIVNQ